jgi:hypothetical protein
LQSTYTSLPGERDDTTFFEYYKEVTNSGIGRFTIFIKAKESVSIGNMFLMDKSSGVIEICNKI